MMGSSSSSSASDRLAVNKAHAWMQALGIAMVNACGHMYGDVRACPCVSERERGTLLLSVIEREREVCRERAE